MMTIGDADDSYVDDDNDDDGTFVQFKSNTLLAEMFNVGNSPVLCDLLIARSIRNKPITMVYDDGNGDDYDDDDDNLLTLQRQHAASRSVHEQVRSADVVGPAPDDAQDVLLDVRGHGCAESLWGFLHLGVFFLFKIILSLIRLQDKQII